MVNEASVVAVNHDLVHSLMMSALLKWKSTIISIMCM